MDGNIRRTLKEAAESAGYSLHEVDSIRLVATFTKGGRLSFAVEVQALGRLEQMVGDGGHPEAALRAATAALRACDEPSSGGDGSFPMLDEHGVQIGRAQPGRR